MTVKDLLNKNLAHIETILGDNINIKFEARRYLKREERGEEGYIFYDDDGEEILILVREEMEFLARFWNMLNSPVYLKDKN